MGKEELVKYFSSHKISCLSKIQIVLCFHDNRGEFRWKDIECWGVKPRGVKPNRIVTDYPMAVHLDIIEYVFELID